MSKTKLLLDVVENLRNLADSIQELCVATTETSNKVEEKVEHANSKKEIQVTLEEVRGILAKKSQEGKSSEVRNLIQSYGVTKLSEINEDDYADLFKKAEVL